MVLCHNLQCTIVSLHLISSSFPNDAIMQRYCWPILHSTNVQKMIVPITHNHVHAMQSITAQTCAYPIILQCKRHLQDFSVPFTGSTSLVLSKNEIGYDWDTKPTCDAACLHSTEELLRIEYHQMHSCQDLRTRYCQEMGQALCTMRKPGISQKTILDRCYLNQQQSRLSLKHHHPLPVPFCHVPKYPRRSLSSQNTRQSSGIADYWIKME